ncbi:hypothetical protein [Methylobacterium goesingense]|uniref:Uncharacterized protein n=1 Tax=Methylobacterium goesingense TaxID=243690 RepID=A0ABV2LEX7_9HYPH|nr:hypothetical protein [Methylobacterium goesingense]GJD75388.1 hypothetical protein CFIICLFH_3629 [Methylobacterium goesingense]
MRESERQPAPGSRSADPCPSYWDQAGATSAAAWVRGAMVWQGIATDPRAVALTDERGLPMPFFGQAIIRLVSGRKRVPGEAMAVALRYAGRMRLRPEVTRLRTQTVKGSGKAYQISLLDREEAELRFAWSNLLKCGKGTHLSDTDGDLLADVERRLGKLIAHHRQGDFFTGRPTVDQLLQQLAATSIPRVR